MRKKLIAFDMYDTFVHTPKVPNPYRASFTQLWIHSFFAKHLASILQTTTKDVRDVIPTSFCGNVDLDTILADLDSTIHKQFPTMSLYDDFLPTIEHLKLSWYRTAVVSNLSKPYSYPLTCLVPKDTFDYKILSYEVGARKPDIKIFDNLKKISWYKSDEIVMVGDSLKSDVVWAQHAGIQPIHIDRASDSIVYHSNYITISTLLELSDVLKKHY